MTRREALYGDIEGFWDILEGEEYALTEVMEVSEETVRRIREATGRVQRIFEKTAPVLRDMDDAALRELGYPEETLPFLRLETMRPLTVIGRYDFIVTPDRIALMEWNADTPTFIKELFVVNDRIAAKRGFLGVNTGEEELLAASVNKAIAACRHRVPHEARVVFTSHGDHIEDRLTTEYLRSFTQASYCPLDQLELRAGDGLYDAEGQRIDILYRQTFPVEVMLLDRGEAGENIGAGLLELVETGLLEIINPPSAFLMQAKSVQALIWMLHETRHPYFDEEEHEWIGRYFLPTYLDEEEIRRLGRPYVRKPVFGREGDTVTIHEADGTLRLAEHQQSFRDQAAVYQSYVELPVTPIKEGLAYMFGSFSLGGKPSAIGVRAGERITGNRSYFLPIGIKGEEFG
ncbi:glutathionylspermidine synthase family protein [Exiguobacterium flavidum]|uniref:glutathionylspermidine synthase family protein n=1 Tax=Exiguobacterium flavidum TaxID=2184695 RepID=UPI000DF84396|nr:glutathionylspermidine synthase family protein [Exiguobacterium flavidum]